MYKLHGETAETKNIERSVLPLEWSLALPYLKIFYTLWHFCSEFMMVMSENWNQNNCQIWIDEQLHYSTVLISTKKRITHSWTKLRSKAMPFNIKITTDHGKCKEYICYTTTVYSCSNTIELWSK